MGNIIIIEFGFLVISIENYQGWGCVICWSCKVGWSISHSTSSNSNNCQLLQNIYGVQIHDKYFVVSNLIPFSCYHFSMNYTAGWVEEWWDIQRTLSQLR